MAEFLDREDVLNELCAPVSQSQLLNVYGETGIGKSRVLQEATRKLQANQPPAFVLHVDMENLKDAADRPKAVLQTLIKQAGDRVGGTWQNPEQVAGLIVAQLGALTTHTPVYLMVDTTEALQEDGDFWDWLHKNLTEPLVIDGRVKQIYAGRIPVSWRRFELRRTVKMLPLGPITPLAVSRTLVEQVLLQSNPEFKDVDDLQSAIDVVLEFSFGHPLLSEKLAGYVAGHWPPAQPLAQFKKTLCEENVTPYINQSLFENVDALWTEILWWASVLDWFDPTILQQYLKRLMPELEDKPDYFFIHEIARLRKHNTVVWRELEGDRLHGLIRDIVRQCLKTIDVNRYRRACQAAFETFQSIADEFSEEESYAQQFQEKAEIYRQQLDMLKETTR
ncbi:MAG: AAA family ATPase [Anaerolineae bacterium]|nr:AAA family ATPase [Anaerolineae bacterium]